MDLLAINSLIFHLVVRGHWWLLAMTFPFEIPISFTLPSCLFQGNFQGNSPFENLELLHKRKSTPPDMHRRIIPVSIRGSSTSDSACNLQACVQVWPCTEPCSLDLPYKTLPLALLILSLVPLTFYFKPIDRQLHSTLLAVLVTTETSFIVTWNFSFAENPNSASPRLLTFSLSLSSPFVSIEAYFGSHHFHSSFDISQISWANLTLHRASCLQWGISGLLFLVS